ncbi:hypothetical protein KR51_00029270 [Rubidibacter lacunae KORDI 51-2]|uniref:Uncharacterized protein n=1 Tax=Rubidibacter lacunae KORDI 51-2 TaxID=582515 RepID=U5DKZ1_9CHRO|nr:hypothetical protein [Rubidibacter lacunae]ERN40390.1 hypothetical protein KR51_00029270 [Rubidibacter lacunae KORDI 51-2]
MATGNRPDWERRLQELDAEINASVPSTSPASGGSLTARLRNWFENLSPVGKTIAFILAFAAIATVLQALMHLIAVLFAVAALGTALIVAYRLFLVPSDRVPPAS